MFESYWPALQLMHEEAAVADNAEEALPAVHDVQEVRPVRAWYVPDEQLEQTVDEATE